MNSEEMYKEIAKNLRGAILEVESLVAEQERARAELISVERRLQDKRARVRQLLEIVEQMGNELANQLPGITG